MPHQKQKRFEHDRVQIDYREDAKRHAQLYNVEVWQQFSRRKTFSLDEQYWTLMDDKSFELETLEIAKLLRSRKQFNGVNDNKQKYQDCVKQFPGISPHFGELTSILRRNDACPKGGIFYLDTMTQLDEQAAVASTLLAAVLEACGPGTLVCANFCSDKPRQGHRKINPDTFAKRLLASTSTQTQRRWSLVTSPEGHDCYLPEKTSATQMITYFFWRAK